LQTVPSIHAQRQAHGRVVRSLPAGLDQTKPQTLYLIDPQPYGSGLSVNVKCEFCDPRVPLDKSEGGVKDKSILSVFLAPLFCQRGLRTKTLEISR
jgi:hypothetical protein